MTKTRGILIEELKYKIGKLIEKVRYKEKMIQKWKESDFEKIIEKEEKIREVHKNIKRKKRNFRKLLCKFLACSVSQDRVTINNSITIRNSEVYEYSKSSKSSIDKITRNKDSIEKKLDSKTGNIFAEIIKTINETNVTDIPNLGFYTELNGMFVQYKLSHKDSLIKLVEKEESRFEKLSNYKESYSCNDERITIRRPMNGRSFKNFRFDVDLFKKMEKHEDNIQLILDEALERIEDMKQKKERIYDALESDMAPYLVTHDI